MSRHFQAVARISIALGSVALAPAFAVAQQRAPDPNATRIMVVTFRAPASEKNLGVQAAESMRSRMRSDFPWKQVYVLPKEDMNAILEASGFPVSEPLAPHDAKALATQVRADEYVTGTATKTPTGFRLEPMMVLTRDNTLVQPLGVHEGANLTAAATVASKELKEARKQLEFERKCIQNAREQKYAEAKAAAREGIAAYPKATLARICLANVMVTEKAPADSLMAISREIVNIDPRSQMGLRMLAQAYLDKNESDSAVVTLTRLLQTDPTNASMVSDIVTIIASTANPRVARPIIEDAVAQNPADPDLLRLRWRILIAVRDYKEAFAAGEELVKLDTANADATYFITMANAYQADSQPQKAVELASRGVAKFPANSTLNYLQAMLLRDAGQAEQALQVLDRAKQANVVVDGGDALRLRLLVDLGRTDEALAMARTAIAAGDTSSGIRGMVINAANDAFRKASTSQVAADWEPVLARALFADSVANRDQKVQSQFILGAVYTLYSRVLLKDANEQNSCPTAKRAKDMIVEAQILLPRGGSFAPDVMRTLMGQVMQLDPAADQIVSRVCK